MTKIFIKDRFINIDVSNFRTAITREEAQKWLETYPLIKKRTGSSSLSSWLSRKRDKGMLRDFIKYCEATGHIPQELYDLNEEFGDVYGEELLEAFQEECDKVYPEGFSQTFNATNTTKSFYKYFGKSMSRGRGTYRLRRVHEKADFSKEDLIPFCDNQNTQFKAMVATLSTIPVRIDAFLKMRWKEVKEVFDDNKDLPFVAVPFEYQKKSIRNLKITQSSFLHSWARKCLLDWRTKYNEISGRKIDIANPESLENPLWIVKQIPFNRPTVSTVDTWFRKRSKEYGKRITPHSFRPFFNTLLRCNSDLKGVFMAQSGRYNGAYIHGKSVLVKRMREVFLESSIDINPLSEDKFKNARQKLKQRLSGYGVPPEEISELARSLTMGLMQMNQLFEQQQTAFFEKFYSEVEKKLNEKRESRIVAQKKKPRELTEEEDFPFTKKSWKGIYPKEKKKESD